MSNWVSAHEDLYNALFNHILQSPFKAKVEGIYDGAKENLKQPYAIIGETDVIETEYTTSMYEDIAVQMHVYADNKPDCRSLLKELKFYAKQELTLSGYEVIKIRLSNEQVMNDIDVVTSHGVLRLVYTVRHKVRYRKQEVI